jgi:hypothetical protein
MNFTLATVANADFEKLGKGKCSRVYFKAVDVEQFLSNTPSEPDDSESTKITSQGEDTTCTSPMNISMEGERAQSQTALHLYFPYPRNGTWRTPRIADSITWCDKLDPIGIVDQMTLFDCTILRSVFSDSQDMLREVQRLLARHSPAVHEQWWDINEVRTRTLLADIVEVSSIFRAKAFRWAVATVGGQSSNCVTRIALVNFVMTASEFGNQLQTRSDALFKQVGLRDGRDARELALSTHLQDTEPTDFIHLYDWLSASEDGCTADWLRRHLVPGSPNVNVENRVKIVDRLYRNHFWSRINTVHASGVGKVNLLFVKDGIGNWNLKNFESYPGELLDAYVNVGKKALEAAAKIAAATSGVGSGGVAIEAALKYANQSIADSSSMSSGTQVLDDLATQEAKLQAQLEQQTQAANVNETANKGKPDALKQNRKAAIDEFQKALSAFSNAMDVLAKTNQPQDNKDVEESVRSILKK